jgi:hypothetical protein
MSVGGRWRVVETPGYDMAVSGAYILFDEVGGEFAFDCITGSIHGTCDGECRPVQLAGKRRNGACQRSWLGRTAG